jgi:hypothetical protein
MTDHTSRPDRDPQAPVAPDAMRDRIAEGSALVGGTGSGVPDGTQQTVAQPGETLAGAGLTDHEQPAEGGREEGTAADDREPTQGI